MPSCQKNFSEFDMKIVIRSAIFLAAFAFLSGCGGGSSDSVGGNSNTGGISSGTTLSGFRSVTQTLDAKSVGHVFVVRSKSNVPGKLDYSVATVYCNRTGSQRAAALKVSYADAVGTVLQDSVPIGASSFGHCSMGKATADIRLDQSTPLDVNKLQYVLTAEKPVQDNVVAPIKIDLYKIGGRAGHEGLFPLNSQYPIAGSKVLLRAFMPAISLNVSFSLLDKGGTTISTGALNAEKSFSKDYSAVIDVPDQPFTVKLAAGNGSSVSGQWATETYFPQSAAAELVFDSAVMVGFDQILTAKANVVAQSSGELTLRMLMPPGFSSDWETKTVTVTKGAVLSVPVAIRTPAASAQAKAIPMLYVLQPSGDEALASAKLVRVYK